MLSGSCTVFFGLSEKGLKGLHSDDVVSWYFASLVPEERLEQHHFSAAQGYQPRYGCGWYILLKSFDASAS